ncbi:hypothetical protein RHMOL_Rhmol01G0035900 [Rhododendron molle]|uniref:Uncharacterized protein n=2 Tax=Rhododendron molle TaxID=49168 RepID=A0ACC0PY97_RHOML|nr:hypothetical protein RHMOL_Rhmol01G0035900 [Rhododendron molle]KAI8570465.1 hypothetical protein RHMOL_Rhmol01G0035900 [Rhododendron molle]
MVSTDASAPLLQVEGETRLLPTLVETTIVKVEVTNIGKNENSVNGGGEPGDVDSGVTVRRKRGWPPGTGKLQLLATMGARMSYIECGEMLLSRCAAYLFPNSDTVSEYVLSSCCKEIIAVKTGIGGAMVK